jgi:hypothetical protein
MFVMVKKKQSFRTGKYREYNSDRNLYTSKEKPFGKSSCDEDCVNKAEVYASMGFTERQTAEAIGVNPPTFLTWLDRYTRLREAWNRGITKLRTRAHTCFMEQAFPMRRDEDGLLKPTGKGNPQLILAYFKSMEGWTETSKQIIEDDRKTFDEMDKEERILRIKELENKLKIKKNKEIEDFIL